MMKVGTHWSGLTALVGAMILYAAAWPAASFAQDVEQDVTAIREYYQYVQGLKKRQETVSFESRHEPVQGTLVKYFSGETVIKATIHYTYGDHVASAEEYFFKQGELCFAFVTDSSWAISGEMRPDGTVPTSDTVMEYRLYFKEGKLIRHLEKAVTVKEGENIKTALQHMPNQASDDPRMRQRVLRHAASVREVRSPAQLESLIVAQLENSFGSLIAAE